jgi:hypothetical protein
MRGDARAATRNLRRRAPASCNAFLILAAARFAAGGGAIAGQDAETCSAPGLPFGAVFVMNPDDAPEGEDGPFIARCGQHPGTRAT